MSDAANFFFLAGSSLRAIPHNSKCRYGERVEKHSGNMVQLSKPKHGAMEGQHMTILIDADGCPVVDLTLRIAGKKGVPVVILCDTSHRIEREGAQTLVFDKGADSVDFALVNRVKPGDLVVTQDYGLASMCLARCARVLNQNGLEYTADNIDALMLQRHENKKLLRAGKHPKGAAKRTKEQDIRFCDALERILSGT